MREEWRERLQESGEIPVEIKEGPTKNDEQMPVQQGNRPIREAYHVDESVHAQAREDDMAQLENDSNKSKSWIGRVFKR